MELLYGPDYGPDRWRPDQRTAWTQTFDLDKGDVVVADRKPFLVDRITEIPAEKWPKDYVDAWLKQNMPDTQTWRGRPIRVSGFWQNPGADTRLHGTIAPACHAWDVLPEHYSVCHKCLEIPPCRHVHNETVMRNATAKMARDMAILPGSCHACKEPITRRQKSFTFPGANLIRPDLGENSAIFHTRRKCMGSLQAYDKRWAAAEEGRRQFLYCDGRLTIHYDQSSECTEPECTAKGELADCVTHKVRIWHHPTDGSRVARGCWCLVGIGARNDD
jgi:hypothetical protein